MKTTYELRKELRATSVLIQGTSLKDRIKLKKFLESTGEKVYEDSKVFELGLIDLYKYCSLDNGEWCAAPRMKRTVLSIDEFINKFKSLVENDSVDILSEFLQGAKIRDTNWEEYEYIYIDRGVIKDEEGMILRIYPSISSNFELYKEPEIKEWKKYKISETDGMSFNVETDDIIQWLETYLEFNGSGEFEENLNNKIRINFINPNGNEYIIREVEEVQC